MISLKALIGRRNQPATPVATASFAERLGDMVSADRMATNDNRVALAHVSRSRRAATSSQRVVRNNPKPARTPRNEGVATNEAGPAVRAGVNKAKPTTSPAKLRDVNVDARSRPPALKPEKMQPVPEAHVHSTPVNDLTIMSLDTQAMLERMERGALERFRLYAKSKKMPLARTKDKTGFANARTQEVWLAWKEADTQSRIQGVGALKEQIQQARLTLEQIQSLPLVTSTQDNVVSDLTMIVKRLAFLLHREDPTNVIAPEAMAYLDRHNLLGVRGL